MSNCALSLCIYMCALRIRRSSSVHFKLKLYRREAPTQHKISPCRRELEPRYDCVLNLYSQQRAIFIHVSPCLLFPQLRAALYDIHDIFYEMPLEDRLALLQQDRELRVERKLRDMVT